MMLRHEVTTRDGSQPGVLRRKSRAGTTFLGAFAGLAILVVGTVAAALVGIHSTPALASSVCQTLPTAPSSPPPGPTPSVSSGGKASAPASAAAASAAATQLCVTVTAATSTVKPGQAALYTIDVQPTGGAASDVTVQISASGSFPAPTFSVCGSGDGTQTCSLGAMKANQKTELQAQDAVPSGASSGSSVTLTAKVTGVAAGATTQGYVSGIASVRIVAPPPTTPTSSKSPSPKTSTHSHHHKSDSGDHSGSSGSGGNSGSGTDLGNGLGTGLGPGTTSPGSDLAPLTGLTGTGSGSNPSSLFPTIGPSPTPSGTGGSAPGATSGKRDPYHPTTVADVLPLNNGLVGGQVAGLVVLAAGIIIAVVRVSVRKPRTQNKQ